MSGYVATFAESLKTHGTCVLFLFFVFVNVSDVIGLDGKRSMTNVTFFWSGSVRVSVVLLRVGHQPFGRGKDEFAEATNVYFDFTRFFSLVSVVSV